jgi:hypothetical protein
MTATVGRRTRFLMLVGLGAGRVLLVPLAVVGIAQDG